MAINDKSGVQGNDKTNQDNAQHHQGNVEVANGPTTTIQNTVEVAAEVSKAQKFKAKNDAILASIPEETQNEMGSLGRLLMINRVRGAQDPTQIADLGKVPGRIAVEVKHSIQSVTDTVAGWIPFTGEAAEA